MRGRILGVAPERESYVRAGHYHQDAGQLGERTVPKAAEENLRKTFFFYFFFSIFAISPENWREA